MDARPWSPALTMSRKQTAEAGAELEECELAPGGCGNVVNEISWPRFGLLNSLNV